MVHSRCSPLYFLTVISAAVRQSQFSLLANLPLCIIKHHMWSTVESRIACWYFLWPRFCTNVSAHFWRPQSHSGGVARRTVAPVTRLEAGLGFQIPPWKESNSRGNTLRRSWSSTGVNYSASDIMANPTVARLRDILKPGEPQKKNVHPSLQMSSLFFLCIYLKLKIKCLVVCLGFLCVNSK